MAATYKTKKHPNRLYFIELIDNNIQLENLYLKNKHKKHIVDI